MQVEDKKELEAILALLDKDEAQDLIKIEYRLNALIIKYPDKESLYFHLGILKQKQNLKGIALVMFFKCLALRKDFPEALSNISVIYREEGNYELARKYVLQALECFNKDTQRKKKQPKEKADYLCNLGTLDVARGTPDKALEVLEQAVKTDPEHDTSRWNRALAYLEKGMWVPGFSEYQSGLRSKVRTDRNYSLDGQTPQWDGTPGKTIVVYGEQGIGDELMFASILPDLMQDCKVIFDAHPRLANMFRESFPGIPVYGTRKEPVLMWCKYHKIDAKISICDIAQYYRKQNADFPGVPYIKPNHGLYLDYAKKLEKLGPKPKIGFSFTGGIKSTNIDSRACPLELWQDIFSLDADFISLQYHPEHQLTIDKFCEQTGVTLHHWPVTLANYDYTCALVANLDFIVSVPQSVVHLAGSIGTPTLQLCPKKALWQMGVYGQDMPWYQCVKNIWQDKDECWQSVMQSAYVLLKEVVDEFNQQRLLAAQSGTA